MPDKCSKVCDQWIVTRGVLPTESIAIALVSVAEMRFRSVRDNREKTLTFLSRTDGGMAGRFRHLGCSSNQKERPDHFNYSPGSPCATTPA